MIIEYSKKIPVVGDYDVVVCGGGPAGISAAIGAAEQGCKTVLIERFGFLGGLATAGLVTPISRYNLNGVPAIGGFAREFGNRLIACGGGVFEEPTGNIAFDPERYKLLAMNLVLESGANLMTNSQLIDCQTKTDDKGRIRITSVLLANRSGLQAITGKYFVDCTGDAMLADLAGAELLPQYGSEQPGTLMFIIYGVDTASERLQCMHHTSMDKTNTAEFIKVKLEELTARGIEVPQYGGPWLLDTKHPGRVGINITRSAMKTTDNTSFSKAEQKMIRDAFYFMEILRDNFEEFRNAYIGQLAATAGARQSRRIKGQYVFTAEDYQNGTYFEDTVAHTCHPMDQHHAVGSGQTLTFSAHRGNIPYRSLITDSHKNIIAAGRAISADEKVFASVRVQATCMQLGEAAGKTAALCVKEKDIPLQELNVLKLQSMLDL